MMNRMKKYLKKWWMCIMWFIAGIMTLSLDNILFLKLDFGMVWLGILIDIYHDTKQKKSEETK